jgi:hypothetical protein
MKIVSTPVTLKETYEFVGCNRDIIYIKCFRYRAGVAQRVGRRIALLFHDRGTRRG